jgi:hypothetical protein
LGDFGTIFDTFLIKKCIGVSLNGSFQVLFAVSLGGSFQVLFATNYGWDFAFCRITQWKLSSTFYTNQSISPEVAKSGSQK